MKKYHVEVGSNSGYGKRFESDSRDSKKHIRDNFGCNSAWCRVYGGEKQISGAECDGEHIYNVHFEN